MIKENMIFIIFFLLLTIAIVLGFVYLGKQNLNAYNACLVAGYSSDTCHAAKE